MGISGKHFGDFCPFSGRFGLKLVWKIDHHVSECEGFESPEAHPCGSSADLEIAYKLVSLNAKQGPKIQISRPQFRIDFFFKGLVAEYCDFDLRFGSGSKS